MIFTITLNPVLDRTLTVPALRFNEVMRASKVQHDVGGKGFNVSRALKLLGIESLAMGFVAGFAGKQLESGLKNLGIQTDLIHVNGETRSSTVFLEAGTGAYAKVNEPGPEISASEQAALISKVRELAEPSNTWILSGSLPPGIPPGFYATLIEVIKSSGAKTYLDASGESLSQGCKAAPFLIKPNLEEAGQVFGKTLVSQVDILQALSGFLDCGIEMVALSAGADGLWLAAQGQVVHSRPPGVTRHNPVGNGDATLAGLVWAIGNDLPTPQIARFATACGTASAIAEGVNFGSLASIEALSKEITVESIANLAA